MMSVRAPSTRLSRVVAVVNSGIVVEPRDAQSLARALATVWSDDRVHAGLQAAARARALELTRTWADVAADTRAVYAEVGVPTRR